MARLRTFAANAQNNLSLSHSRVPLFKMNCIQKPGNPEPPSGKLHLLGIGLDNQDGHKRITKADRFAIVGGSQETHERMTETVVKAFETLDRKGKTLDTVEKQELADIIDKSRPE